MHWSLLLGSLLTLTALSVAADLYAILGVDKSASENQIKSAFKKLTLIYHPDKNRNNEEVAEKYIEIQNAYEILSNREKRTNYDECGDPEGCHQEPDFGDIFNQFFGGGGGGGGGGGRRATPRAEDVTIHLKIGLEVFYYGKNMGFDVGLIGTCDTCKGTGLNDGKSHECSKCNGQGHIIQRLQLGPGMFQQIQMPCDACGGRGKNIKNPCSQCGGEGARNIDRHHEAHIPAGAPRGTKIRLRGKGAERPGVQAGDLICVLIEDLSLSKGFRRVGQSLYRTEALSARQASEGGWKITIPFLNDFGDEDAEPIVLSRPLGKSVVDGEVERVVERGMPKYVEGDDFGSDEFGDLFIEYKVIPFGGKNSDQEHDEL